jgi:hypothetical protein
MAQQFVWLVTGSSSGFGAEFVRQILERGDKVIATARNVAKLAQLKVLGADLLQLDVTASQEVLDGKIAEAFELHGRIDVLVNSAGYIQTGNFMLLTLIAAPTPSSQNSPPTSSAKSVSQRPSCHISALARPARSFSSAPGQAGTAIPSAAPTRAPSLRSRAWLSLYRTKWRDSGSRLCSLIRAGFEVGSCRVVGVWGG